MTQEKIARVLADHKAWLADNSKGRCADLRHADLSSADLSHANLSSANLIRANLIRADLRDANLRDANLRDADLRGANLRGANLRDANLRGADLRDADLRDADLSYADLSHANLRHANLRYADLDYASWPLWCGSLSSRIDKRLAAQLLYHAMRAMQSCANDPEVAAVLASKPCLKLANRFHRVRECGAVEPPKRGGAE